MKWSGCLLIPAGVHYGYAVHHHDDAVVSGGGASSAASPEVLLLPDWLGLQPAYDGS